MNNNSNGSASIIEDILGTGWHFPTGVDGRGGLAFSRHEKDIDESIIIILSTAQGERHMRPKFGCRIHEMIFAPNNATTWGLVRKYVAEALGYWEPRIEVEEIQVQSDPEEASRLLIDIKYKLKATSDKRSLVYPFYLTG